MVVLSKHLVLQKTRAQSLADVTKLNLWGSSLSDVSILAQCPKVQVLSLSVNAISSLGVFGSCPALTELYLRKNAVDDFAQVASLSHLSHLSILWLWDNPIADDPAYRAKVLALLPNLSKLDNVDVTPDEVAAALSAFPSPAHIFSAAPAPPPPSSSSSSTAPSSSTTTTTSSSSSSGSSRRPGTPPGAKRSGRGSKPVQAMDSPLAAYLEHKRRAEAARSSVGAPSPSRTIRRPATSSSTHGHERGHGHGHGHVHAHGQHGNFHHPPQPQVQRRQQQHPAGSTTSAVLAAILTLLPELDEPGLDRVVAQAMALKHHHR